MVILASTGVQGNDVPNLAMIIYMFNLPGLLIARAYAISNHYKLIVWVFGALYIGYIGCELVCLCLFSLYEDGSHFHGISQYIAIIDSCMPADIQLNNIVL